MLAKTRKKLWKGLLAFLGLIAILVAILANWEAAWYGLQKLLAKL